MRMQRPLSGSNQTVRGFSLFHVADPQGGSRVFPGSDSNHGTIVLGCGRRLALPQMYRELNPSTMLNILGGLTLERSPWEGGENEAVGHLRPVGSAQRWFQAGDDPFGGEKRQANQAKIRYPGA
jgi:hypothetical protein